MKKIYSTLALAALVCASASAVKPASLEKTSASAPVAKYELSDFSLESGRMNAPAARVAGTIDNFLGFFSIDYRWRLQGNAPSQSVSASITQISGNQVSVQIAPWTFATLVANVDPAAGTITFNTAANSNLYTHAEYGTLSLEVDEMVPDPSDPNKVLLDSRQSITGTLQADGSILFDPNYCLFYAWSTGGYNMGMSNIHFVVPDYFTFDPAAWEVGDQCTFEEKVMNPVFKTEYQAAACQVPYLLNKGNHNIILLQQPYSQGGWSQLNERAGSQGYLFVDKRSERAVGLRPLVASGFWLDMGEQGAPNVVEMFIYNQEGEFIYGSGLDPEELADVFEAEGIAASTYDPATKQIKLINCCFGDTENPLGGYVWQSASELSMTITMPADYVGAVEGIEADDVNAPKTFYNLQGVKVANPVAGEIVIVKQGSKTYKTIAK